MAGATKCTWFAHRIALFCATAVALSFADSARAACSSPTANIGSLDFQTSVFKYCDGTNWVGMLTSSSFPLTGPNGTATGPTYSFSAGTNTGMYSTGPGTLAFTTAGTQSVTINNLGYVGIGTPSPGSPLDIRFATSPLTDNGSGTNALRVSTAVAEAANLGGALSLGGWSDATGANGHVGYAQIAGRKTNSTSGDFAGYMQFATNGTNGTMTERMRIDSAGNVGIGTTSASAFLHVSNGASTLPSIPPEDSIITAQSAAAGNWNAIDIVSGNTGASMLYFSRPTQDHAGSIYYDHTSNFMSLSTANAERMRINSSGYVGIGTTSPTTLLDVAGTNSSPYMIVENIGGTANQYPEMIARNYRGTATYGHPQVGVVNSRGSKASPSPVQTGDLLGNLFIQGVYDTSGNVGSGVLISGYAEENWSSTAQGASMEFYTTPTGTNSSSERMRITPAGNVGIGTSAPWAPLQVNGAVVATSYSLTGGYPQIALWGNSPTLPSLVFAANTGLRWDTGSSEYDFVINNTLLTGINASGMWVAGPVLPSTDNTRTLGSATNRWTTVYATTGAINTSDVRQKKNIELSDLGLDFVNSLRPVTYRWKMGGDQKLHYGVIAQETDKAIRDAKVKAGVEDKHDDGIVDYDKASDRFGVRYTELIAPLIKAVQEIYQQVTGVKSELETLKVENANGRADGARDVASLNSKIESLQQENEALKARLDKIEKRLDTK